MDIRIELNHDGGIRVGPEGQAGHLLTPDAAVEAVGEVRDAGGHVRLCGEVGSALAAPVVDRLCGEGALTTVESSAVETAPYGWTSLMIAASAGKVDVCTDLLRRGADPRPPKGEPTAADLARLQGHLELAERLDAALPPAGPNTNVPTVGQVAWAGVVRGAPRTPGFVALAVYGLCFAAAATVVAAYEDVRRIGVLSMGTAVLAALVALVVGGGWLGLRRLRQARTNGGRR